MSLVVYLGKMLEVKVSINLSGRDIGVAQQFLDTTQVMTGFQQVRGKRVPKEMRKYFRIDALVFAPVSYARLDRALADSSAAIADE